MLCYLEISAYNIIMPTTYTVSIDADGRLNIRTAARLLHNAPAFKTGLDGSTGITFDENFWRDCFTGDSEKDGCSAAIQNGFIPQGWPKRNGEYIKGVSSQMTSTLEENSLIFKAEILRLKNYKGNIPEAVKTQFSTAFPEDRQIFVNKDCGLDPEYFLPNGRCIKSCNIASDVIDPHSSSTADCARMLPGNEDTLVLDESVFAYLQYPCVCSLSAKTTGRGTYNPMSFMVDGVDLMTAENINKYFVGNAAKNALFSKAGTEAVKKQNKLLCVAKYSGDTLQSLIQRIFELINAYGNSTYVVSTCDSIVSLRSCAMNGSYIEVCNDNAQDKVTQVYVWRPNLANPEELANIFQAEKTKILAEYDDLIELVNGVEPAANGVNNIYISGSDTSYRFNQDFYTRLAEDLTLIQNGINNYIPAGAAVADIAQAIRVIRTFKVNDFLKVNGPQGQYYCINLATKYTKGNLALLGVTLPAVNADGNIIGLQKRVSQSFFEKATQNHRHMNGGARSQEQDLPFVPTNFVSMIQFFFNLNFYSQNLQAIQIHGVSTSWSNRDHGGKTRLQNRTVDLHQQFLSDFNHMFDRLFPDNLTDSALVRTKFDCFSDVINSFAILDMNLPNAKYYSEEAIGYLINQYFSEKQTERANELRINQIVNQSKINREKKTQALRKIQAANKKNVNKGSQGSQGRKKPPVSSFARSRHSSKYLSRRPADVRGGSKTRKNKK
jgi:hypothetical protein